MLEAILPESCIAPKRWMFQHLSKTFSVKNPFPHDFDSARQSGITLLALHIFGNIPHSETGMPMMDDAFTRKSASGVICSA